MAKFQGGLHEISTKHAPTKSQRVCDRVNPWVNRDIINMTYEREYKDRKAIQLKNNKLWAEYKRLRNKVTREIKQEKNCTTKMRFTVMLVIEMECGKLYIEC